jgi:hypothetical protein
MIHFRNVGINILPVPEASLAGTLQTGFTLLMVLKMNGLFG